MCPQGACLADKAAQAGSGFVDGVVNFFQNLPQNIANFLNNVISNVGSWVSNMGSKARSAGSTFVSNVVSFIQNLPGKIGGFLSNIIGRLGSWAGEMASKGRDGAKRLFDAVVNGINNMVGWIGEKIRGFGDSVLTGLKNFFGIASPSKLMRDKVGKYIAQGIGVGFESEMGNVAKQMQDAMPDASAFSIDGSMTAVDYQSSGAGFGGNDGIVDAVIEALGRVHIVLDDEVAGKFVERTVTNAIYA